MSTIDLILLGALCQSPKSAYDLQKLIEQRNLSRWVKIGSYTVYKKVVLYESKGYVTGEAVRTGKMPEKTLYTITPSGKKAYGTGWRSAPLEGHSTAGQRQGKVCSDSQQCPASPALPQGRF